ncbi:MAG: GNAT family N-acetyltransferase [Rickettsiales bacterium]|jgi:putative hemolysin|nr:GNAT family N-acetyltransferase [Rickettsiales bacterium]
MAIKVRDFEVRLTRNKEERRQVRALRYTVFVEEEGASATEEQKNLREEYDSYDRFAEYMGVFHNGKIVGTYRIIDREAAEKMDGFYTETEYDLKKIKKVRGNIAEMSRACVAPEYRDNGLVMRMLWMGLADYLLKRKVVLMFGVASFVGTHPAQFAQVISYLYYNHLSPLSIRARVESDKMDESVDRGLTRMRILPQNFVVESMARAEMTPLIKGYLRLGATFGLGVFIDKPFNSCDVFVVLQSKNISKAYQKHFTGNENAFDHLSAGDGAMKKLGRVMLSPFTGSVALFKAAAQFFLRDDADDAELADDETKE